MIDGGRHDVTVHGHDRGHAFHSPCTAEQVPGHALGGADVELVGVLAEKTLDGLHLLRVADGGLSTVRIDVIDLPWAEYCASANACFMQSSAPRPSGWGAVMW